MCNNGLAKKTMEFSTEWMNHIRKLVKMGDLALNPPEIKTGQTPKETVFRRHRVKLIHYKPKKEKLHETPLLITYAMVNKPYILDLLPGRSVIDYLLLHHLDVFLIDWGEPTQSDRGKGLDVYINDYMDAMIRKTLELTGAGKLNLLGYCMGGTMSLIYTALNQELIKNLILMAAPFDCTSDEGLLFKWTKDMPVEEIAELYGNCPGWLPASSFLCLNPMGLIDKSVGFYKGILDNSFVEAFLAMEKWINDTVDIPGQAYTDFMRDCIKENLLPKNMLTCAGKKVDLNKITSPFLNLIANLDTSVPPSCSHKIGSHISSADTKTLSCDVGHIGLAVSGRAFKTLWPEAAKWIKERSGQYRTE